MDILTGPNCSKMIMASFIRWKQKVKYENELQSAKESELNDIPTLGSSGTGGTWQAARQTKINHL